MSVFRILNGIIEMDREPIAQLFESKLYQERDIDDCISDPGEYIQDAYNDGYEEGEYYGRQSASTAIIVYIRDNKEIPEKIKEDLIEHLCRP